MEIVRNIVNTTHKALLPSTRPKHSVSSDEIWIAEDNQDIRLILSRAFRRIHPSVSLIFFKNGAELVEHFKTHPVLPRLLLLDMQMPVMDGLQALRAIRARGCCGGTPVVMFSSLENPDIIRSAYFLGAKLYLKKPDKFEEYADVAKLCASCAEAIHELPASAIPFGALEAKRVLKLVAPADQVCYH